VTAVLAVGAFLLGVVIVVWSTERLLDGMVGLAALLRAAPFVIAGIFSGLEAENVAVGVVAARAHHTEIALGTVFGGGSFIVCVALGLGAVLFPLRVQVPRGVLLMFAVTPVLAGVALIGARTTPAAGVLLLAAFAASIWYLVWASRRHDFLGEEAEEIREEVEEHAADKRRWWRPIGLTLFGLAVITIGAELVNYGADGIVHRFAFPAAIMGMIITPAAIEAEEVIRQAVPSRHGRHDVAAGNLIGTLLYFVLFNLGLIAVAAPVAVPIRVIALDWPFLIAATWLATLFLWRGRVTRRQGILLLAAYGTYIATHALLR
jgi:cation:H+ antiporter